MNRLSKITVQREREKSPIAYLTETAVPIVSKTGSWEINQKWKQLILWPKTSIRNPAHDAIVLLAFLKNQRLCSILGVGVFGQELVESSPCRYDIFELADQRHLSPISSGKPSRNFVCDSLPHENEKFCDFACGKAECMGLQSQVSTGIGFFDKCMTVHRIYLE